jgi:hypothetical protein
MTDPTGNLIRNYTYLEGKEHVHMTSDPPQANFQKNNYEVEKGGANYDKVYEIYIAHCPRPRQYYTLYSTAEDVRYNVLDLNHTDRSDSVALKSFSKWLNMF